MPSTAQRKKRRQNAFAERHLREDAEARNRELESQLRELHQRPPAPRPGISTHWDWRCSCGRLVFSGKRFCDICGCTRAFSGTTVTGSVRGVMQTTQAAVAAVSRQQRVPGLHRPTYAAAARASPPVQPAVAASRTKEPLPKQQPLRTGNDAARGDRDERRQALQAAKPEEKEASGRAKDIPTSAGQLLNAENADDDNEADEQTNFEDADADPKVLRFRHIKLCRKIEGKQKQLGKQQEAIELQQEELATQQAKLVELQSQADATSEKIKEIQGQSAELALQIARIEEDRRQTGEVAKSPPADQTPPPEEQAFECLSKAAAALQGFRSQSPKVQVLLQQFTTFMDQLRAEEVPDPKQTTIHQAFASTSASIHTGKQHEESISSIPAVLAVKHIVPFFDISGSQSSEGKEVVNPVVGERALEVAPEAMQIVGECPGDKRKSDCLNEEELGETAKQPVAAAECSGQQQLGTPTALLHVAIPTFVPQTRDDLLVSLALRNRKQCEERKARTEAQHQKSCPY